MIKFDCLLMLVSNRQRIPLGKLMFIKAKKINFFCRFLIIFLVNGCAQHTINIAQQEQIVLAQKKNNASLEQTMAPAFQLTETQNTYNKIGQVIASGTKNHNTVTINPDRPIFYVGTSQFTTEKNKYTNLIYRVHFLKQPYSLLPFNYGAGQHVGLLVILTLNQQHQVILVTTAQTCGCYTISIPTEALDKTSYPRNWPTTKLPVAGELLPARLPAIDPEETLQVVVRPEVHRVMDIKVVAKATIKDQVAYATFSDLTALKQLPLEDGTYTSLYYERWPLTGHVKGAIKPWETLFLGLPSFDLFVGMDKEYGNTRESGNPFYTSLKPWNRQSSDLNNFPVYLKFNGWNL